jgi:thiol-disulfide isomerase/thioredoxin
MNNPVALLVFYMNGCPACEEFLPRFKNVAKDFPQLVPHLIEINSKLTSRIADRYRVKYTPTMVLLHKNGSKKVVAGAVDDDTICKLFEAAVRFL